MTRPGSIPRKTAAFHAKQEYCFSSEAAAPVCLGYSTGSRRVIARRSSPARSSAPRSPRGWWRSPGRCSCRASSRCSGGPMVPANVGAIAPPLVGEALGGAVEVVARQVGRPDAGRAGEILVGGRSVRRRNASLRRAPRRPKRTSMRSPAPPFRPGRGARQGTPGELPGRCRKEGRRGRCHRAGRAGSCGRWDSAFRPPGLASMRWPSRSVPAAYVRWKTGP